jgi:hypothetical protein
MTDPTIHRNNASYPPNLCSSAHSVGRHDEQLGLCFQVNVPCGSNDQEAVQNFRQYQSARNLAQNVATRIHQSPVTRPPAAVSASSSQESEGGVLRGIFEFLLALTPLGWSGCSPAQPATYPEVPDGSPPPPGFDPECDGRRTTIQTSDPLASFRTPIAADGGTSAGSVRVTAELNRQYPGITLPSIDISYLGTPVFQDSAGNLVSTLQTSDPVSFARVGNTLYILTANSNGGSYAPATLLAYDVSATPPSPVPIASVAHDSMGNPVNAIILGYYNPVAMATLVGNTEIDILYGAPNAGIVSTVDPFSNRLVEADWCSTHSTIGDGGSEPVDASVTPSDSGGMDAGMDADASVSRDGGPSSDASDASLDAADARDSSRG